jgi:hypothetical protein
MNVIYFILQYPLPKSPKAPIMQHVLFPQDGTHCAFIISRSPKSSHMGCHTTIPKILDTFIISLALVPIETCKTFRPFLDILGATKV